MKYSTIHWAYDRSRRNYAGATWITYSAQEHRDAMATIAKLGGFVHDWQ